jgi:hypothetical protein
MDFLVKSFGLLSGAHGSPKVQDGVTGVIKDKTKRRYSRPSS